MNMTTITKYVSRTLFTVAFVVFGIAFLEIVANQFDYTILREAYSPGRLIELSAAMMVFVIALLLRQIRDS